MATDQRHGQVAHCRRVLKSSFLTAGVMLGCLLATSTATAQDTADLPQLATALLEEAAFHGGVIAHVGCGDGQFSRCDGGGHRSRVHRERQQR